VLFSGGWAFLILAGFFYVMDVRDYRAWAFPLTVLGLNSIAVYVLSDLSAGFLLDAAQTHLWFAFGVVDPAYYPLLRGLPALAAFWLFFY
jgi:predicted acyltransferase